MTIKMTTKKQPLFYTTGSTAFLEINLVLFIKNNKNASIFLDEEIVFLGFSYNKIGAISYAHRFLKHDLKY